MYVICMICVYCAKYRMRYDAKNMDDNYILKLDHFLQIIKWIELRKDFKVECSLTVYKGHMEQIILISLCIVKL